MSEMAARKLPAIDLDDFERRLRHAPQPADMAGDPLSELARLVAKDDPFKSMFDDMPSPARGQPAAAVSAAVAKIPAAPLDLHAAPQDHYTAHKDSAADMTDSYQAPEPVGHEYMRTDGEDQSFDPAAAPDEADDRLMAYAPVQLKRAAFPRKALVAGIALSVVALAGVAVAVGFRGVPGSHIAALAPVIKAATGPVKVQPPQSETAEAAAAPSVLDKAAPADAPANAKVVSREEVPTDIAAPVKTVKTVRIGEGAPAAGASAAAAPSISSVPEPKRVKTVLVRPDGSIIGDPVAAAPAPSIAALASATGQTPSPKPAEVKAAAPKATELVVAPVKAAAPQQAAVKATTRVVPAAPAKTQQVADAQDSGAGPLQISPTATAKAKPVKTASRETAAPAAAEETVQTTGSTTGGAFAVQLAAPASEQEAKDASARAVKQYASALGSYQPTIHKATDKSVYRVRVSNLSKDEADALCGKLKAAGGACFVAHN